MEVGFVLKKETMAEEIWQDIRTDINSWISYNFASELTIRKQLSDLFALIRSFYYLNLLNSPFQTAILAPQRESLTPFIIFHNTLLSP